MRELKTNKDNMEEYRDAELYDWENEGYQEDILLLKEWAEKKGGPIIEIGCGTGRVTIPVAEAGHQMIGVDLSEQMLYKAKEKCRAKRLDLRWEKQDATKLNLGVKSPFIFMTGHTFQHFLSNEEQDLVLQAINKHLVLDGVFIFNTRFPSKEELLQPTTEEYWRSYTDPAGRQVQVSTIAKYDPILQLQHYTTIRRTDVNDGSQLENRTNVTLRYVYPQETKRLLRQHGFEILDIYDSWQKKPISEECYSMVYICQRVK